MGRVEGDLARYEAEQVSGEEAHEANVREIAQDFAIQWKDGYAYVTKQDCIDVGDIITSEQWHKLYEKAAHDFTQHGIKSFYLNTDVYKAEDLIDSLFDPEGAENDSLRFWNKQIMEAALRSNGRASAKFMYGLKKHCKEKYIQQQLKNDEAN